MSLIAVFYEEKFHKIRVFICFSLRLSFHKLLDPERGGSQNLLADSQNKTITLLLQFVFLVICKNVCYRIYNKLTISLNLVHEKLNFRLNFYSLALPHGFADSNPQRAAWAKIDLQIKDCFTDDTRQKRLQFDTFSHKKVVICN